MRTGTLTHDLERSALEALRDAVDAVGLASTRPGAGEDAHLVLQVPGRDPVPIEIVATSIPSGDRVRTLLAKPRRGAIRVVVADQVPTNIRTMLNDAGVGWLDRRGRLRLVGPGLHIDTDVPPRARRVAAGAEREPIRGRSGLAAAAALLLRPDESPAVSKIARIAGLNPSSISRAMTSLANAHLAERRGRGDYRALVPELFWSLADVWPREHVTIRWAIPPEKDHRLHFRDDDVEKPGWAAAGVRGAVAWGAPIVATVDFPIRLYAPDERLVREAKLLHEGGTGDEAILSADPVGLVTGERFDAGSLVWPVAHPLFCALDLTMSSRDREALEEWIPPEGFTRVW